MQTPKCQAAHFFKRLCQKTGCLFFFASIICSCGVLKESSEFSDGYYQLNGNKMYVTRSGDSITAYGARPNHPIDTIALIRIPAAVKKGQLPGYIFTRSSFDIDVITMPIKYRPTIAGFPNQLNAQINGGGYIGKRRDYFTVREVHAPMVRNKVAVDHFGFSYGVFFGIGATAMNSWVTNNQLAIEYDGVILTRGVAAIIGLNKFTVGLAIGSDHLMDPNRKTWIYQERPWLGLAVGLSLN